MQKTQLHLRIWTCIVLYYLTYTEHTTPQDLNTYRPVLSHIHRTHYISGFEHISSCIISHTQNTLHLRIWTRIVLYYLTYTEYATPQDLNTYRPVLSHIHRTHYTSGFEHISSCIISHTQNTLHLRIWTHIVLYYLTYTEHTTSQDLNTYRPVLSHIHRTHYTSGFEHVSSLLSHMHRAQRLLRFWTPFVLNYLTCTEYNCTSGFEHVSSSRLLSHYTELHRFSVIGYKINLTVKIIHIDHVLLIHKAINLALDTARA